jgi:hypothetical protein
MTTQWNSQDIPKDSLNTNLDKLFKEEYAVILLQGKNTFGDMIYSYLKVAVPDIKRLYATLHTGQGFNPSDFGTVVAAGKGEPSEEVRTEMATTYKMLVPIKSTEFPAKSASPEEKKKWDEY